MSKVDELRARAEELGVKVDRRWGAGKLSEVIAEAEAAAAEEDEDDGVVSRDWDDDDQVADEPAVHEPAPPVPPAEPPADPDDGWPKRIAPCAWVDQNGRRWPDLGLARQAVDRIRRGGGG
jgi:hypothetical protein